MRYLVAFCLFLASHVCLGGPVHVDGSRFRTAEGRHVLLRGINVAGNAKVPPFRGIRSDKDFAPLRGWGFNTVRLLFNWEAFEPEPGLYDWDYLNYYSRTVDWAAQHDLYAIVDIHQDGFSRYSIGGCGEGFPKWALPPFQKPAEPDNGKACANWGVRMLFDIPMHTAWHHFYSNTYGVRDRYLLMLRHLTEALADAPNVVGFDLLNEPWGLENTELPQLYQQAGTVIHSILPETVLFLSSHALTSAGIFPSSLPPIPLKNIVHATHFYDPGIFAFNTWTMWTLRTALGLWQKLLQRWQSPIFLGEFGAPAHMKTAANYLDAIYDMMDRELYSGAQWVYTPEWNAVEKDGWNHEDFSINDDQGQLRGTYRPRPFVEEASGDIVSMRWNEGDLTLTVVYDQLLEEEELLIAVPARLQWISLGLNPANLSCAMVNPYRLRCVQPQRAQSQRTLTLQFQS